MTDVLTLPFSASILRPLASGLVKVGDLSYILSIGLSFFSPPRKQKQQQAPDPWKVGCGGDTLVVNSYLKLSSHGFK